MSIYKKRSNYRKIYEQHFGSIPVDRNGRTYDIHHIDGDHTNNSPENLKAVTVQEHYNIHYSQGDFYACFLMSSTMDLTSEELSNLSVLNAQKRLTEGTHNFLNGEHQRKTRLQEVANGTHPFLGGNIQKEASQRRLAEGTHNFLIKAICPHCGKEGQKANMSRYHFNNCKLIQLL